VHGNDTKAIAGYIITELKGQLPMHVNDNFENTGEWFFNNAGGAMGNMFVIHASMYSYSSCLQPPIFSSSASFVVALVSTLYVAFRSFRAEVFPTVCNR
jgi:hypothetical protein